MSSTNIQDHKYIYIYIFSSGYVHKRHVRARHYRRHCLSEEVGYISAEGKEKVMNYAI